MNRLTPEPPSPLTRKALRSQMIARRLALPADAREPAEQAIRAHLSAWLDQHATPTATIGVYMAIRGEPSLSDWYVHRRNTLALPVVIDPSSPLQFAAWRPGDALASDRYGIAIPVQQRWLIPDVLIVPCVGFTTQRFRLGYGGGYYDRTLATLPRSLSVGIAFDCQHCQFAAEDHDRPLDAVISETGVS